MKIKTVKTEVKKITFSHVDIYDMLRNYAKEKFGADWNIPEIDWNMKTIEDDYTSQSYSEFIGATLIVTSKEET